MTSSRLQRISGPLLRSSDFGAFHETLLLTAVATVLFIRTQLWLTNYPQIGRHGLSACCALLHACRSVRRRGARW